MICSFASHMAKVQQMPFSLSDKFKRSLEPIKDWRLYYSFVDLEKAFDRVPREVVRLVRWALRKAAVEDGWLRLIGDV